MASRPSDEPRNAPRNARCPQGTEQACGQPPFTPPDQDGTNHGTPRNTRSGLHGTSPPPIGGTVPGPTPRRPLAHAEFDDFTRQRLSEIGARFNDARRQHQRTERLLWLGTIAAGFTDDELSILDAMGFLSESDHDLMRSASRPIGPWPPTEETR